MKLNVCLILLGTVFLALTGFLLYTSVDSFYYKCDEYNCTYTHNNNSCRIDVHDMDYICTQIPCNSDKLTVEAKLSQVVKNEKGEEEIKEIITNKTLDKYEIKCFMPKNHKTCPTKKCYSKEFVFSVGGTISSTLLTLFMLIFIGYHFTICIRKCCYYHDRKYILVN